MGEVRNVYNNLTESFWYQGWSTAPREKWERPEITLRTGIY